MVISNQELIYNGDLEFPTCVLNIDIKLNTYGDDKQYYNISYKWNFVQDSLIKIHPFFNDKEFLKNSSCGEIIFKNSLTDKLIEYLIMDNCDLETISGTTDALTYKQSIIKSISMFWD